MTEDRGTLKVDEAHPAVESAKCWFLSLSPKEKARNIEALSSCAIEGNRLAEVCSETLYRILNKLPVSDRYFLGLCWTLRNLKSIEEETTQSFIKSEDC